MSQSNCYYITITEYALILYQKITVTILQRAQKLLLHYRVRFDTVSQNNCYRIYRVPIDDMSQNNCYYIAECLLMLCHKITATTLQSAQIQLLLHHRVSIDAVSENKCYYITGCTLILCHKTTATTLKSTHWCCVKNNCYYITECTLMLCKKITTTTLQSTHWSCVTK